MAEPVSIVIHRLAKGTVPFEDWYWALSDSKTRAVIQRRLKRMEYGNLGIARGVGGGVFELKIDFGPGYRVYCALIAKNRVVVLTAGTKGTQKRDIMVAQFYLEDFKRRFK